MLPTHGGQRGFVPAEVWLGAKKAEENGPGNSSAGSENDNSPCWSADLTEQHLRLTGEGLAFLSFFFP